jgi:hypothetical protein
MSTVSLTIRVTLSAVTIILATYDTKKNDDKIWGTKKPYHFPQSFVFFSSQTFHQQAHAQISNLTENADSFDFNFELYVQSWESKERAHIN